MSADSEWVIRCADRLSQTWVHLSEEELRDTATQLGAMEKWRELAPELAAIAWLRLVGRPWSSVSAGVPARSRGDMAQRQRAQRVDQIEDPESRDAGAAGRLDRG